MTFNISPIRDSHPAQICDFFKRIEMPSNVVAWRYFDRAFNRDRNRGYVWLQDGRVVGMIGLIPFMAFNGDTTVEAHWSCDWAIADPAANPGMGILLLKHAIAEAAPIVVLGGNVNTRSLLPRIATQTYDGAALAYHLPLRSGAILRRLEARFCLPSIELLHRVPLRLISWSRRMGHVFTEAGLTPAIAQLIEASNNTGWHPRYDFDYIDWQIGRSPLLICRTSRLPRQGPPRAATLAWRARDSNEWRVAFWYDTNALDLLEMVLGGAIADVYAQGASSVSVVVSRVDDAEITTILRRAGFLRGWSHRSLYVCSKDGDEPMLGELNRLSYLDADLGFRF